MLFFFFFFVPGGLIKDATPVLMSVSLDIRPWDRDLHTGDVLTTKLLGIMPVRERRKMDW